MSYSETITYIYNLRKHGIKLGLQNINRLVSILGNPHKSFLSVHVAGTNGKGSTSAIIASILKASGFKAGLFTSPHLISFTERIKVNDEEISENEVISLTEEIRRKIADIISFDPYFSPTFFEVVTAMAFLYFQRKGIDIAVIEVGMGGRLDATNIVIPKVSVITSINFDHMEYLGETLKEIASEKASIIKEDVPVVVSSQVSEVLRVINEKAEEKSSRVYLFGKDFCAILKRADHIGVCFDYRGGDSFEINDLYLPLPGEYQIENASVGIKAVELINQHITHQSIRDGLASINWRGRLEMIQVNPPILIDGAHNPAAAEALTYTIRKHYLGIYKRVIFILGIMGDKDIEGIMRPILPIASEVILTSPNYDRAAHPEKLAGIADSLGYKRVKIAFSVKEAIKMAIGIAGYRMQKFECEAQNTQYEILPKSEIRNPETLIVITGSFYTIGEAKETLGYKGL
ncbi:MAG: bifunctional folylpolyglutamate synthase/dihydrofolate synthase, partial [Thermodesulfovibrionales bacterium]